MQLILIAIAIAASVFIADLSAKTGECRTGITEACKSIDQLTR